MKPQERRFQTATQVKVLSPVNSLIREADSVHLLEGNKSEFEMARIRSLFRGLSPRYEIKREAVGTWEIPLFSRNGEPQTIRRGENAVISSGKSD